MWQEKRDGTGYMLALLASLEGPVLHASLNPYIGTDPPGGAAWQDQDETEYMLELRRTWTQGAYVRVVGSPKPNSNGGAPLT